MMQVRILEHISNGVVHPDLTRMSPVEKPALRFHVLGTYEPQTVDGYMVGAKIDLGYEGMEIEI